MAKVMINYDLKREDGDFEKTDFKRMVKIFKKLVKSLKKRQCLVLYVELADRNRFKKKDDDVYKMKGPKGA